jgi:hypothetical protein
VKSLPSKRRILEKKRKKKKQTKKKRKRKKEQGLKRKGGETSYEQSPCFKRRKEKQRMKFTSC